MQAIQAALLGRKVFCKFLSANDTGVTGAHQAGIYIYPNLPSLSCSMNPVKRVKIRKSG
ncbi:EcoRII N-terminal effector-binding domain-containing protein [Oscillibacter sp.]|uniref:EcoRII N-terminal effector-binding domain-containing protein n=1 Tax=Oscillibacter sp. TaxID=1945593 RepID=UPI00289C084A|nr:EcoRII N-terminal effector-binding domain-containing protein [Oscillibacter sp.]